LKNFNNKKHKSFLHFLILIFIILSFYINLSFSQTRVDSLEYLGRILKVNYFNTRFDKQLNTFYLNSQFQLFKDIGDFTIRVNENYGSTYIRSVGQNTRDEQHLNIITKYNLNKNIILGIAGNSSLLSDNRSLGINESAVNFATFFSELRPIKNLSISPFGGYANNRQIGILDEGFVYGLEGLLDNLDVSDLEINSQLRFKNEDILPRRNLLRSYELSVSNEFEKGVSNNIGTSFSQSRKDFYFNADSITSQQFNISKNLQGRTETAYLVQDRLFYDQFLDIFSLDLGGRINWRRIDRDTRYRLADLAATSSYDTKIEELKLELDALTRYSSKSFNIAVRFNYYERDEKNSPKRFEGTSETIFDQQVEKESQKNNNSTRATLSLSGNIKISSSDNISFSLYQSKLRYDTQSILNDDDRDELLSIIRLRYLTRLTSYFSAFINVEGTYGHTVYLFASKSSNNNKNRIIRLRAGGDYYGSLLKSFNSFEVSANYTVYDFEDKISNYQSYSFRQFTAVDSTTITLTKKVVLFNYAYLKLSEVGDFRWNNFSARPTRFLKEIYLEPRLILNINNSIFSAGLRFFLLDTYSYNKTTKILESDFLSIGPIAIIDLFLWKKLNLIFRGYYEFISNTDSQFKEQASLIMQVNWKF
jgi:hypothetical protein